MIPFKSKLGEKHITNEGYEIEIIESFSYKNNTIRFQNGVVLNKKQYSCITKGRVKNPLHPSVGDVGYYGLGEHEAVINGKITKKYNTWSGIIKRSYSKITQERQPSYKNCLVDERWHNYQVFGDWFEENYNPEYMMDWALDKDILVKGNKIYSPETCCFVPREINNLFLKTDASRGKSPIGVVERYNGFQVFISKSMKRIPIGTYKTVEEAFQAYKTAKEVYIKEIADKWKDLISPNVYQAMYNYQVEITD